MESEVIFSIHFQLDDAIAKCEALIQQKSKLAKRQRIDHEKSNDDPIEQKENDAISAFESIKTNVNTFITNTS